MSQHTQDNLKDEMNKQVEFICELSVLGQEIHPNDIKHCFEKVITKSQSELRAKIEGIETHWDANNPEHDLIRKGYYLAQSDILKLLEENNHKYYGI